MGRIGLRNWLEKKTCATWVLSLLILLAVSVAVQAETGTTADGFAWSSSNSAVTITGYTGSGGAVQPGS